MNGTQSTLLCELTELAISFRIAPYVGLVALTVACGVPMKMEHVPSDASVNAILDTKPFTASSEVVRVSCFFER